jgi:Putative auto-transporter adhesin, head GIN domain
MTIAPTPVPRDHTSRRLQLILLATLVVLAGTIVVLLAADDSRRGSSSTNDIRGSGVAAAQERTVPPFTALDLAGSSAVTVSIGEKQAVVVRADDNLIDFVTTDVQRNTLVLGTVGSFAARSPMTVEVTVPALETVVLSGSGIVRVEGLSAEQLTVHVPGSGLLSITGTAEQLDVSLSGAADVRLQKLVARDVVATLSGSGRLLVHATRSLDASVPGSGVIVYGGDPASVTTDASDSGVITKQ